jgi:hypothetical protein
LAMAGCEATQAPPRRRAVAIAVARRLLICMVGLPWGW